MLLKIKEWHTVYFDSLPEEKKASYDQYSVLSDLRILMCTYFQTYCGYFTYADFDCPKTRNHYFYSNKDFIEKYNKKAYIKINIQQNELDNIYWEHIPSMVDAKPLFPSKSRLAESKNALYHTKDMLHLYSD